MIRSMMLVVSVIALTAILFVLPSASGDDAATKFTKIIFGLVRLNIFRPLLVGRRKRGGP